MRLLLALYWSARSMKMPDLKACVFADPNETQA